jgi:hypothetical protein
VNEKASQLAQLTDHWKRHPDDFVVDSMDSDPYGRPVVVDKVQKEILQALADYDRVAVVSGRGVGKTASAAMASLWWLATRSPAAVVTSAGTWSHIEDKLWPEINAWARHWRLRNPFEWQSLGVYSLEFPETWKIVSTSSDKAQNVEGFHSPNLLLVIDEAKSMSDEVYSALIASLSGDVRDGEQKALVLSTPPTADVGWFAHACSSPVWRTVHASGLDSKRVSRDFIREIAETFGENSNEYKAYVLGVIPQGGVGQLIQKAWLHAAQRLGANKADRRPAVITCDVARFGDDLTTIGALEHGKFSLVRFEDRWGWFSGVDLMATVKRIGQALRIHPTARAVCIDDSGLGGGVTDRLRELQTEGAIRKDVSIIPINFGSKPRRPDRFDLRKDELWWGVREAIRIGDERPKPQLALPTDEELAEWRVPRGSELMKQLSAPIYESNMQEQIRVFDKRLDGKERTKSLPSKSPDMAHALVLGVDYYLKQEHIAAVREPATNQEEAIRRMMEQMLQQHRANPAVNPFRR